MRRGIVAVALAALACARPAPEAAAPAPVAAPAPLPVPEGSPEIDIEPVGLRLDRQAVPVPEPDKVKRIDALFDALRARGHRAAVDAYPVTIAGAAKGALVKSVIQTAAFAGWPVAELTGAAGPIRLRALVPMPGRDAPDWPERVLVIGVRAEAIELWRVHNAAEPEPAQELGIVSAHGDMAARFASVCATSACSPAVLLLDDASDFAVADRALAALAKTVSASGERVEVELRLQQPGVFKSQATLRVGQLRGTGRLPPAEIQRIVRANYDLLRRCYEAGLARNQMLEGSVVVRFVIGLDGAVKSANADAQTDIPDAAVASCVVEAYKTLRFPAPAGGSVTVVYPIKFSPG